MPPDRSKSAPPQNANPLPSPHNGPAVNPFAVFKKTMKATQAPVAAFQSACQPARVKPWEASTNPPPANDAGPSNSKGKAPQCKINNKPALTGDATTRYHIMQRVSHLNAELEAAEGHGPNPPGVITKETPTEQNPVPWNNMIRPPPIPKYPVRDKSKSWKWLGVIRRYLPCRLADGSRDDKPDDDNPNILKGRRTEDPVRYRITPRRHGPPNFEFTDVFGKAISQHYIIPADKDVHGLGKEVALQFLQEEERRFAVYQRLITQYISRVERFIEWHPPRASFPPGKKPTTSREEAEKAVVDTLVQAEFDVDRLETRLLQDQLRGKSSGPVNELRRTKNTLIQTDYIDHPGLAALVSRTRSRTNTTVALKVFEKTAEEEALRIHRANGALMSQARQDILHQ